MSSQALQNEKPEKTSAASQKNQQADSLGFGVLNPGVDGGKDTVHMVNPVLHQMPASYLKAHILPKEKEFESP